MFLHCPIKDKVCGFCGSYRGVIHCGIAKNDSRIASLTKCPYKPRKRK